MTNDLTITEIGTINSLGWTAPKNLSYDNWLDMAPAWGALHKGSKFGLGDWLNHGETRYGEKYAQGEAMTGISPDLLMTYTYVSRSVPIKLRNQTLSWWHHKLVAPYTHQQIAKMLHKASRGDWSSRKLDQFIKRWRRWVEGPPRVPKSRKKDDSTVSITLPLFSAVKEDVIGRYPTASPNQAADLSRFVVDQLRTYRDNGKTEHAPSPRWKRIAKQALQARRGWKRIAKRAEEQNTHLKAENAKLFEEILALNERIERLTGTEMAPDKDWREKILEDY